MACNWCAAKSRMGALCHPPPRATHHAFQEATQLSAESREPGSGSPDPSSQRMRTSYGILDPDNITVGALYYIPLNSVPGGPYPVRNDSLPAPAPSPSSDAIVAVRLVQRANKKLPYFLDNLLLLIQICKVHIVQRGVVGPLIEMLQSSEAQLKEMSAFALGRLA